jgi:hypothetical protein
MWNRLRKWLERRRQPHPWRLVGWDTFSGESYRLEGSWRTEEQARQAARLRLRELERLQPTSQSGGQQGIQDHVHIVGPKGANYRFRE